MTFGSGTFERALVCWLVEQGAIASLRGRHPPIGHISITYGHRLIAFRQIQRRPTGSSGAARFADAAGTPEVFRRSIA